MIIAKGVGGWSGESQILRTTKRVHVQFETKCQTLPKPYQVGFVLKFSKTSPIFPKPVTKMLYQSNINLVCLDRVPSPLAAEEA